MRLRAVAIALLALSVTALAGRQVSVSDATFSAQTQNPGNTLTTSTSFPGIRVASGSYTGTATDNRNITGVGFQPDAVIVKRDGSGPPGQRRPGVIRTSTTPGDNTKPLAGATALQSNMIQALLGDGFQLGNDGHVNSNGIVYDWVAFKSQPGHMALGSYTGTGANRSITGLGFSPEYVIVGSAAAQPVVQRMAAMSRAFPFDSGGGGAVGGTGATNAITSLDSDGFSLATNNAVNQNGTGYAYLAFNQNVDEMQTSSYTGNGAANRSVTGVGFQPAYVIVRANDTATARNGDHRPAGVGGTTSLPFDSSPNFTNGITALQSDGFQVGNSASVNNNSTPYAYVAFKDNP